MPNFNLPMPNLPAAASNALSNAGNSANGGGMKIQLEQMYSARLETLGNQISQVKIAVGQQTVTQPLPQLPNGVKPQQNYQIKVTVNDQGQPVVSFFPEQSSKAGQASQLVKLSLSDAQLVKLLSLDKNYQLKPDGSVTVPAKLVAENTTNSNNNGSKTLALKLPGLPNNIKLPQGLAELLTDVKQLPVTISAKGQKIELQLTLPGKTDASAKFQLPLPVDRVITVVKNNIAKSTEMTLPVGSKGNASNKITLPNNQTLALPSKSADKSQANLVALNQRQLTIKISPSTGQSSTATPSQSQIGQQNSPPLATVVIERAQLVVGLKQSTTPQSISNSPIRAAVTEALVTSSEKAAPQLVNQSTAKIRQTPATAAASSTPVSTSKIVPTNPEILIENVKSSNNKAVLQATSPLVENAAKTLTNIAKGPDISAVEQDIDSEALSLLLPETAKIQQDYTQQKQQLSQLIDPLIRLLLPKKLNWSEGFQSLAALEKLLPDTGNSADQKVPDLKQLLEQLRNSIPDHTSPLTEKNISAIVSQLLNFSPNKVMTSPQPTPANAIASALQLLLGSKVVQNEAKITPQLIQQLGALLKPHTDKEETTPKGIKALTAQLAQAEQSSGSVKSLAGLSAAIRGQQLENVEKKFDGNPQIQLSVPLKMDDEVKELKLTITEDEEKSNKTNRKTSVWQLNLTFDLNELGKLLVNAKLKEGEVNIHLYAEKKGTLNLMNKFSSVLEQRLEFHGVKIKNIQSSLGKINDGNGNRKLNSLLQIKV